MAKTLIGIDLESSVLKIALVKGGEARAASERLPENLVKDNRIVSEELLAKFIRQTTKKYGLRAAKCAFILPDSVTFFRRMNVPAMSVDQLVLNLPYEFRDYVGNDAENYYYDYAVEKTNSDEGGTPVSLDLMAAAVQKNAVAQYFDLCKRAGMKLTLALPREMALINILKNNIKNGGDPDKESCLIEIASDSTRIFIFSGETLNASRVIEYGCSHIDTAIASELSIDEFLAATYRATNHENSLELGSCMAVYENISAEIRKAVNFYIYNNPDNSLKDVYFCGDGAEIKPLTDNIISAIEFEAHGVHELLHQKSPDDAELTRCAMAVGIAL